jgi:serine phosphatase RsbU (regulator of sigma subunit)
MNYNPFHITLLLLALVLNSGFYANDATNFESLVKSYLESDDEEVYQKCLTILGSNESVDEYQTSLLFAHKAFQYYDMSVDSVVYFLNKVDLENAPKDDYKLVMLYNRALGLAYAYEGSYESSLEVLSQNFELAEKQGDPDDLMTAYSDAAVPHYFSGNDEGALDMWKRTVEIALKNGNFQSAYNNSLNIALIHGERTEIDSAYAYRDLCAGLMESQDLDIQEEEFNLNMGVIEYYVEDYEKAISFFDLAKKTSLESGNEHIYIKATANVSSCYLELGDAEMSLEYLQDALKESSEKLEKSYRVNLLSILGQTYYDLGEYKLGYQYLDSSKALKDELINETRTKQMAEFQEKFKSAEKDKIIAEQKLAYQHEKSAKEQEELKNEIHEKEKWYLYIGIGLVALFGVFMYRRYQASQRQKRTIEKQKVEVESQKTKIEVQHNELEEVHREMSDSINYAEKLQLAILPDREDLIHNLGKGFVLFMPKDVVSGDFYWTVKKDERVFFAAADCTGHGVPGAMVSVVCSNALNRAVNEMKLHEPADILNATRELVIETFARSGQDVKDGMDIGLCSLESNRLHFSGANNPLWVVRKSTLVTEDIRTNHTCLELGDYTLFEVDSDRQPVGLYSHMEPFTTKELQMLDGDTMYVFTDGYADQFGGEKGKKMKYKPFKRHLLSIQNLSMDEQRAELLRIFKEWKADFDQIDDVCVIGVRI